MSLRRLARLSTFFVLLTQVGPASASEPSKGSPSLRSLSRFEQLRASAAPALSTRPVHVPVVVELDREPARADFDRLEALGARFERLAGRVELSRTRLASGSWLVSGSVPPSLVEELTRLPSVRGVYPDGSPMRFPRPLVGTTSSIGVPQVWGMRDGVGRSLSGEGLTICDIDSGIDVLHPMFFRDDGGGFDFVDVDGDGRLTPGVDTVDLGSGPVVVRHLDGIVASFWSPMPRFGSAEPAYDTRFDYLYADEDGSGTREAGASSGFDEQTPGYGERLFVPDDADGNGVLDVGERLIALGSSKIKAFRIDNKTYRRGVDLIEAPLTEAMSHGTGAASVLAGGQLGRSGLVGVAPGADLVMATDTRGEREVAMTQFCIQQEARVVLHEYAPWVGYHLDGSSPMERLIDTTSAQGVVHVNPAGNLSGSQKLLKRGLPPAASTDVALEVPAIGIRFLYFTLLWRDPSRDLELTLVGPSGRELPVSLEADGVQLDWDDDTSVFAYRSDSERGTAMATVYLFSTQGNTLVDPGSYTLRLADPSEPTAEPVELIAYVADEVSGWGKGAHFPEFSSEDHLVGYPGTADRGMAISAYTGNDYDGEIPGQRASYSGRGRRIDDASLLWLSGPDNPIAAGTLDGRDLGYIVYGGTSGASPHVAGAAAIVLQADPSLDGEGVKAKLREGAVVDAATGAVPNDDFGWGKLHVYRSLYGADPPGGEPPVVLETEVEVPTGPQIVALSLSDPDEPVEQLRVEVDRDYDGVFEEALAGRELAVSYDRPGPQRVRLRVIDSSGREGGAVLRISVLGGPGPDPWSGLGLAGGGFCGVTQLGDARGSNDATAVLALAFGAACAARRRRRSHSTCAGAPVDERPPTARP